MFDPRICVGIYQRSEAVCCVAFIALAVGDEVPGILPGCDSAVVAAVAGPRGHIGVIEYRIVPTHWVVAIITLIAAGNVSRIFASGDSAVVAALAGSNDLGVIYRGGRSENDNRMAVFADICCWDMHGVLARGINPVVTARAIGGDVGVIKIGGCPGDSGMAIVTLITTGDVGGVFAGCDGAVVTAKAGA